MPKTNLPIANGFYRTDSLPISSQNCVNLYPVIEDGEALSNETLRGVPGVEWVAVNGITGELFDGTNGGGQSSGGGGGIDGPVGTTPDNGGGGDNPDAGGTDIGDGPDDPLPSYAPECLPYACDVVEARFSGMNLVNLSWPLSQSSILPNDTFPVNAGVYTIQAPPDAAAENSWTTGTSVDNAVVSDNLFGYDPCVEMGYIFRSVDTNFFNHLNVPDEGGFNLYFAALVRGDDIPDVADTADGVIARVQPELEADGAGLSSRTLTFGVDLVGNAVNGIALRINTLDEWNGAEDSTASLSSNTSVSSPQIKTFTDTKDFRNLELIVYEQTISPSLSVFTYLVGGLFLRYGTVGTLTQRAYRYYYDENGDEGFQEVSVQGRQFCFTLGGTSNPSGALSIVTPGDIDLLFGNLKASGIWFTNAAIDHAALWQAVKQNRVGYTPPDYC